MPGILQQHLFHKCMKIVLQFTHPDSHECHIVIRPDGSFQLTMAIMMAWIADLEEQWVIARVRKYSCPVCMTLYRDLDQWSRAVGHTPRLPETTIAETCRIQQLYPEATTYEFKHKALKHKNGLSGTVEEFCWEGLPVGLHIFLAQDLLPGCYKFI